MSTPQNFQIGQTIYVLSNKNQTVLPGVVHEEILHRTRDGNTVSYKLVIGPQGGQKVVDLTRVDGEIYGSLDDVREVMTAKFTEFVDNLCARAKQRAEEWYGIQNGDDAQATMPSNGEKIDPSVLLNEVSQPQPGYVQIHGNQAIPMQRNGTQQHRPNQDGTLQPDVIMPDGSIQKISINLNPKQ